MLVEVSDDIIASLHLTIEEVRLGLALWLFQENQVSIGKCARVAGLHKIMFQKELAKRNVYIKYDIEDLEKDLKNLETLR